MRYQEILGNDRPPATLSGTDTKEIESELKQEIGNIRLTKRQPDEVVR